MNRLVVSSFVEFISKLWTTVHAFVLDSFMNGSTVSSKFALFCCFIVTYATFVLDFFMNGPTVSSKTALSCCFIDTYAAFVLDSFMNSLVMSDNSTLKNCRIFTYSTLVLISFVYSFMVSSQLYFCYYLNSTNVTRIFSVLVWCGNMILDIDNRNSLSERNHVFLSLAGDQLNSSISILLIIKLFI